MRSRSVILSFVSKKRESASKGKKVICRPS